MDGSYTRHVSAMDVDTDKPRTIRRSEAIDARSRPKSRFYFLRCKRSLLALNGRTVRRQRRQLLGGKADTTAPSEQLLTKATRSVGPIRHTGTLRVALQMV
jgi:hypothetical protein